MEIALHQYSYPFLTHTSPPLVPLAHAQNLHLRFKQKEMATGIRKEKTTA